MNLQFSSVSMLQRLFVCLSIAVLCSLFSPATADATIGGPDGGGYIFVDSFEAQCDTTFTDISNTGTPLDLFYDVGRHIILPFDFTFYGQTSSDLYIKNGGFALFDTTDFGTIYSSDVSLPTSIIYRPGWFPYWDELAHDTGNVYYETLGTEPNRQFIVQWHYRSHLFLNFGGTVTFQLVLYENTNTFDFVYDDVVFNNAIVDSGVSATIGIQNASGSDYLQYSYMDDTFFNQGLTAICFVGGLSLTNNVNTNNVNIDQALPGESITYTLMLENKFNTALGEVILIDTLPPSFTVTSVISSGLSITETSTQPYTWQVGDMQPGSSSMITIVGTIDDDLALLGTTLTNTAYLTGNGVISSLPITSTVHIPLPDLSGSYKIAPPFTRVDQALNYQIVLTNSAIMTATDAILTDPIPTNTVYITGSVTGATYNPSLDRIEWSGDIGPRSEITLTYAVSITSQSATVITNTATLIHTYLSAPLSISTQSETFFIKSVTENFCIDFEEGALPASMTTSVTTAGTVTGRAQVEAKYAHNGDYALHLDTDSGGESIYTAGYTTQAATLFLDMSAVTDAELSFWVGRHNDEYHGDQDGLFISDDGGATYSQIFTFHESRNQYHNNYYKYSVDLNEVIASRGMTLTQNILLKFQSYDNGPISDGYSYSSDGFSIDDICITAQPAEIEVQENDVPIANSIGTQVNYADFGEAAILFGRVEHTFTIHNTGTGTLLLNGIGIERSYDESYYSTAHEDFEIVQPPLTEVLSGLSTSFRVAFSPTVFGLRQAIINIFSNDEDESLYRFGVRGSGVISPLVSDGSTIKILSSTYVVEGSPLFGYENISLDVEGIDLSRLEDARFEIKYDPTTFYVSTCDNEGLAFELIQCDISRSTGRIQIHVKASGGISGDELLTRLTFQPQTNDGIGVVQIVPTLLMNSDNEFVEPILEHGLITFVSELEPTEVPTEVPTETPISTDTPALTDTPTVTDTPSIEFTATLALTETPIPIETATLESTATLAPTETVPPIPTDTPAPIETPISVDTATVVPTDTVLPTETATPVPMDTPVPTDTATVVPTDTVLPTETATPVSTDTPVPTDTATVVPTATTVPTDTLVPTQAATEEPTETLVPTNTMIADPTNTSVPTDTAMPTPTIHPSYTAVSTPTTVPSATAVPALEDTPTTIPSDTPQLTETATAIPTDTATSMPTDTPLPTATQTSTPIPAKLVGEIRASQTVYQRDNQVRYDLSIENQGETTAENVRVEIAIPTGLEMVEDQPLAWELKEGRNTARQNAGNVYQLSLGDLAPQSTTDDTFILLSVADDLPSGEDVEISAPSMTVVADGDVASFTADAVAETNIIIEADEGETPTNLENMEEPSMKLFLPIIKR